VAVCTVNRTLHLLAFITACHVGRPPPAAGGFKIDRVIVPVAEPGLKDALSSGLGQALSSMGALRDSGAVLNVAVLVADTSASAVGPNSQMHTATLSVLVQTGSRTGKFAAERSYTVIDAIQGASARAEAFDYLVRQLMRDAATWAQSSGAESQP